jgi:hypothetical protein
LLARLRRRLDEPFALEGDAAGAEFQQEPGCRRLANLIDKGHVFPYMGPPRGQRCGVLFSGPIISLNRGWHQASPGDQQP